MGKVLYSSWGEFIKSDKYIKWRSIYDQMDENKILDYRISEWSYNPMLDVHWEDWDEEYDENLYLTFRSYSVELVVDLHSSWSGFDHGYSSWFLIPILKDLKADFSISQSWIDIDNTAMKSIFWVVLSNLKREHFDLIKSEYYKVKKIIFE